MSEIGTVVGSIRAELDLGIEKWKLHVDEAKVKARELDALDPTVEVHAKTAGADAALTSVRAKVDAVAAAEGRLRNAVQASDRATAVAILAQMRLEEVQGKRGRTALQVASAEEALRFATQKSDDAAIRATAAEDGLAASRSRDARAAVEESAATDMVARAQKTGQKQAVDWRSAMIGGLVAVSAAAPPVAAVAVGLTGAFGAMGVAGVLGVAGIARGLKANNEIGQQYRGTVAELLTDVHALQDAGAKGLLPGSEQSVAVLSARMPALNASVGHFAGLLGADLPVGLDAVVNLTERAEPLFNAAGGYIARMVHGLDDFSRSSAYGDFLDYSIKSLPQVEQFLGDTVHLVGDFIGAWAPLGTQTLPMLDDLVTGVDDIVRHTGPLVPGIIAVVGAYKLLSPVIGIVKALTASTVALTEAEAGAAAAGGAGGAATAAGGGALAGRAVAGGAVAGIASKILPAAAIAGLVTNLPGTSGGDSIGSMIEGFLPKDWRVKGLATDIASSNVTGHLAPNSNTSIRQSDKQLAGMVSSGDASRAAAAFAKIKTAADSNALSISDLVALYPKYGKALAAAANGTKVAAVTVDRATHAWMEMAAAQDAAAAKAIGLEGTYDSARDAIAGVTAAVKSNGSSLKQNSAAGRQNRETILQAVAAIQAHGAEMVKDGSSSSQARVANDRMALSLINTAVKAGISRTAAERYIDKLLGIPKGVSTKVQLEKDQAQAKLDSIRASMNNLNGTAATVYINAVASGIDSSRAAQIARNAGMAHGGTVGDYLSSLPKHANGSTVRGPGTSATDSVLRWVANGEEVTSNLAGQADRFRPVLKAINSGAVRSPGELGQALGGGQHGPQTVITRTVAPVVHIHYPATQDPVAAAEEAGQLISAYAAFT